MDQQTAERNHAIDALRVSAFGLLMLYHLGMGYVSDWGWHIKSAYLTDALHIPMLWSNQWRMSLLFLISGFALAKMVRNKPLGLVMKQRLAVLGLPLLAGIFVWIVPQVYVELAHQGAMHAISSSEFLIRYWHPLLDLPAGYGRLTPTTWTWNHLWFLPYVMSYCGVYLVFAAVATTLKTRLGNTLILQRLPMQLALALLFIVPCLGYWQIGAWLYQRFPTTHAFYNDWFNHASYFWSFLIGAMLVHTSTLLKHLGRYWLLALVLACATFVLVIFLYTRTALTDMNGHLQGLIWSSNRWLWQLTALAAAVRFLSKPFTWVTFFKSRIFCYYIAHQTLLVVAIYGLTPWRLGALETVMVLASTIIGCELSYRAAQQLGPGRLLLGVTSAAAPQNSKIVCPMPHKIKQL